MSVERHIRDSGQHPGHSCPVCGGAYDQDIIINVPLRLLVVCGVPIRAPKHLLDRLQLLYDHYARPVNRQILDASPVKVRKYLHRLRMLVLHTRLVIRDVGADQVEMKVAQLPQKRS